MAIGHLRKLDKLNKLAILKKDISHGKKKLFVGDKVFYRILLTIPGHVEVCDAFQEVHGHYMGIVSIDYLDIKEF
jgi:hypothetical protein